MTMINIRGNSEPIFDAIRQGVEVKLILLNCDCILIDKENLATVKFVQLLSNRGLNIDEDLCQQAFKAKKMQSIACLGGQHAQKDLYKKGL